MAAETGTGGMAFKGPVFNAAGSPGDTGTATLALKGITIAAFGSRAPPAGAGRRQFRVFG